MAAVDNGSTSVIVTDLLESDSFREILKKKFLHNFSKDGKDYTFIFVRSSSRYLEQGNGLCQSIVSWAIQLCRSLKILPSTRSLILPVNNQQRALQLCIAKLTKQKCGEYVASASDVLDAWKFLCVTINPEFSNKYWDDDVNYNNVKEAIETYKIFLKSSSTLDHFDLIKLMGETDLYCVSQQNLVFIIEELEGYNPLEQEILKVVLKKAKVYKAIPQISVRNSKEIDFNVSGIELNLSVLEDDDHLNPEVDIIESMEDGDDSTCIFQILPQETSFEEVVNDNSRNYRGSELSKQPLPAVSERYVEQIYLAYFRLLINSRDELALATLLSMPGREISTKDFTKIKYVANKKNMPIYQTIISTVLRLKLGGKGYQPEKSCPIVLHAKSLSEFVNLMHKLQNIIEEEKDGRRAYERILYHIKCALLRSKGCTIPQKSIEAIFKSYLSFCHRYYKEEEIEALRGEDANNTSCQTLTVNKSLQPALKLLIELCDYAAGQDMNFSVSDIIGEQILTPKTPITNGKMQSPFRVPSVLSLFSSPQSPSTEMQSPHSKGTGSSTPLRVRMLRKVEKEENSIADQKTRFQSCCAWASDSISPINKSSWMSVNQLSPIAGSTLIVPASRNKERINWDNVFDGTSNLKNKETTLDSLPAKIPLETKAQKNVVKKNRKRSLLSDISNLKDQPESKKLQNEKPSRDKVTSVKNVRPPTKNKPLLKGQTAITSFFKR